VSTKDSSQGQNIFDSIEVMSCRLEVDDSIYYVFRVLCENKRAPTSKSDVEKQHVSYEVYVAIVFYAVVITVTGKMQSELR
jgi:hypothetical protein